MSGILRNACKTAISCGLRSLSAASKTHTTPQQLARCFSVSTKLFSEIRPDLKYTEHHEWVKKDGEICIVGITDHAQGLLGDVVFCELPEVGTNVESGEQCGSIESVKAVSDIYSPVSGEVTEINSETEDSPGIVNESPYDKGWLFKVKVTDEISSELMDEGAYTEFVKDVS